MNLTRSPFSHIGAILLGWVTFCGCLPSDPDRGSSSGTGGGSGGSGKKASAGDDASFPLEPVPSPFRLVGDGPTSPPAQVQWFADPDNPPGMALTDEHEYAPLLTPISGTLQPGTYRFVLTVEDGGELQLDTVRVAIERPDAVVDATLAENDPAAGDFREIQAAIDAVGDGSARLIFVRPGVYPETIVVRPGVKLLGGRSATGTRPLVLGPATGVTPTARILTAATIQGLSFRQPSTAIDPLEPPSPGAPAPAIRIEGASGSRLKDVLINDVEGDGVRIISGATGLIEDCVIRLARGEGIDADPGVSFSVVGSRLERTNGSSIFARGANTVSVADCVIVRAGFHGLDLVDCIDGACSHNTVVDAEFDGFHLTSTSSPPVDLSDNLVVVRDASVSRGIFSSSLSPRSLTFSYVFLSGASGAYYGGGTSAPNDTNDPPPDPTLDPQFRDRSGLDFRLGETSPCKGTGSAGSDRGARGGALVPQS